ncbi:MAG: IS5 family transposase [Gammaproteobacteria bacterium]|nr:IS5 family transposase [Gammaproteobacteria bacterium]
MSQPGFFDLDERHASLDKFGDPLVALKARIPWEDFRPIVATIHDKPRQSNAGRKPLDPVMMFKVLILQSLYNVADEQIEYQIRDRLSFMRFLDLSLEDSVPDARTVWSYRQQLTEHGLLEPLFERFNAYLVEQGYQAKKGQIVDASIVPVPKQRNTRTENAAIKAGEEPEGWADQPAKRRQKDTDARWTKKHGQSHYGYKNHLSVDRKHKLIRVFAVSDAAVHDSQMLDQVLDEANTGAGVWADSAYRSADTEQWLNAGDFHSQIHHKGKRGHALSEAKQRVNKTRSKVRALVEHVFGFQENSMGGKYIRTIGMARARTKIGLMNLTYNMKRYIHLQARQAVPIAV